MQHEVIGSQGVLSLPTSTATVSETVHHGADTSIHSEFATARVLPCHYSIQYVAFAPHVIVDMVAMPAIEAVPGVPYYAYGLVKWRDKWIPLIHLDSLVLAYPLRDKYAIPHQCLILAYQVQPGDEIQYGALAINSPLIDVQVSNADSCPLPNSSDLWQTLAISCFQYKDNAVPILDAARIFGSLQDY